MSSLIDLTGDDDVVASKPANPFQVNVRLLSLDDGLDRNILLSERVGLFSVDVGRASKNASRDMYPQKGNTWIESPVMSRQHAILFIEVGHDRDVWIKDLDSTHGTKINGSRMLPHQKIRILTGDVLEFGATITSGPQTYRPKRFEVKCLWTKASSSPIVLTPSPSSDNSMPRTFRVPSPGDSEDEEADKPGSNDSLLQPAIPITQSFQGTRVPSFFSQTVSDTTAAVVPNANTQSNFNPKLHNKPDPEATSRNIEAPQSIPIGTSSLGPDIQRTDVIEYSLCYGSDEDEEGDLEDEIEEIEEEVDKIVEEAEEIEEEADEIERDANLDDSMLGGEGKEDADVDGAQVPLQTSSDAPRSPSYSPSSPVYSPESPQWVAERSQTEGDNRSLHRRRFSEDYEEPLHHEENEWFDSEEEDACIDVYDEFDEELNDNERDYPSSSCGEPRSDCSECSDSEDSEDSSDSEDDFNEGASAYAGGDQVIHEEQRARAIISSMPSTNPVPRKAQGNETRLEREPSPSDAAMAKSLRNNEAAGNNKAAVASQAPALDLSSNERPIVPQAPRPSHLSLGYLGSSYEADQNLFFGESWPYHNHTTHRGYSQGPFATAEADTAERSSIHPSFNRFPMEGIVEPANIPYFGGDQLMDMELGYNQAYTNTPVFARVEIPETNDSGNNGPSTRQETQSPAKISKLPISDLVNKSNEGNLSSATSSNAQLAGLKRKVDMISSDELPSSTLDHQVESHREPFVMNDTSDPGSEDQSVSEPLVEEISVIVPLEPQTVQAAPKSTTVEQLPVPVEHSFHKAGEVAVGRQDDIEPAPKRVKTTHPQGQPWLRSALTHGIAGVASVAAFVLTVIATVPDDIKNEAFSEY